MKTAIRIFFVLGVLHLTLLSQEGLVPAFPLEPNPLELHRLAQPDSPFDKLGPKFALMGTESGSFEAWAYPLKLLRNFEFSFFIGSSTRPIQAREIIRRVSVTPEATVLTFTFQSFTLRAIFLVPRREPGALILLDLDSNEPLKIVCGFLPVLQPMWPAGIGGQYAFWDDKIKAYIISESSRRNHGIVGSPAASGISYTPAHMLSDFPSEFQVNITEPQKVKGRYIPIAVAGGQGKREDVIAVYRRLLADPRKVYLENIDHFRQLQLRTLRIETPAPELDLAFAWAKVAFDGLMVENPDLGSGMVAGLGSSGTSGRPGFGWFFGGDAFINSFSLNSCSDYQNARCALAFTRKWQRADGKMPHELSQGAAYIDWFKDYPYAYIHADTTPFYITAVHDYFLWSGDLAFLLESWPSLRRAFDFCLSTDANGDGLMDNRKAGLGGVEYGALTGIETDIYLASVWVQAAGSMAAVAELTGDKKFAAKAKTAYAKAVKAFDEKFWDEKAGFYAFGFDAKGERVQEITPTAALGLMWNLGTPEHSRRTLERLCRSDLLTDWGVRSVAETSRFYEPLNYNYGAVWPFNNCWVAAALFGHGFQLQGFNLLLATARHTFDNNLGAVTEVFSGSQNIWPREAVSHQGFSSTGVVLPMVRGLFGLRADAGRRLLVFAPEFPAHWEKAVAENWRVGPAVFSITYAREKNRVIITLESRGSEEFHSMIAPGFWLSGKVKSAVLDGKAVPFKVEQVGQLIRPQLDFAVKPGKMTIVIEFETAVEILPPPLDSQTGDADRGLKIISVREEDGRLKVECEGLCGQTYELGLANAELVPSITGAQFKDGKIIVSFPPGSPNVFVNKIFTIETKR